MNSSMLNFEQKPKSIKYPYLAVRNENCNSSNTIYTILFTALNTGMIVYVKQKNPLTTWLEVGYYANDWDEKNSFTILPPATMIQLHN